MCPYKCTYIYRQQICMHSCCYIHDTQVQLQPSGHIFTCDQVTSGIISSNQYHITSGPFLCFSIFPVYSAYNTYCSTLVLVLPLRYLHAVCTALAFVPLVHTSSYYTSCLLSYSSALPLLLIKLLLCIYIYKLVDTPLYT